MKSSYIKLIGPVVGLMLIAGNVLAQNGPPPGTSLAQQVAALQAQVKELQSRLQNVSRTGTDLYITAANLHIVSGSGHTDGPTNGLGNLIVGYNELRTPLILGFAAPDDRSGSHNIVVGQYQNFSSYGGLVCGEINTISGPNASVSGGVGNTASGGDASVSGGQENKASGSVASVSGGLKNTASAENASVSGGNGNTANAENASVSGGAGNTASGIAASISGGQSLVENYDSGWAGGSFHTP
jgi:hypothetical protein